MLLAEVARRAPAIVVFGWDHVHPTWVEADEVIQAYPFPLGR